MNALFKYTLNKWKWSLLCLRNWTLMELLVLCTPYTGFIHFPVYRKMYEFEDVWSFGYQYNLCEENLDSNGGSN